RIFWMVFHTNNHSLIVIPAKAGTHGMDQ
ncbi:MAG: hypothetical protein JWO78_69, partial [Micavibrio sp.]|nr:hypothetical protein [Micavibrio sp.]